MAKAKETQALLNEALAPSKCTSEICTGFQTKLIEFSDAIAEQARRWRHQVMAMERAEQTPELRDRAEELRQTLAAIERERHEMEEHAGRVMQYEAQFHRIIAQMAPHAEKAGYKLARP
jgi:hypothetical protein